jgi:protocatechuate 3,4-dioxygenase beta subunit
MKRRRIIAGVAIVVVAALAIGWWRRDRASSSSANVTAQQIALAGAGANLHGRVIDPRKLERASVEGTITDDARAPIAHARVCVDLASSALPAELTRDPRCADTDVAGRYRIGDLFAAEIRVSAMARTYIPAFYHPDGDRKRSVFELHAGEHRTGVDLALAPGGVEVTGTVSDIAGGPIARARVRDNGHWAWWTDHDAYPATEADEAGKFSLWVSPGDVTVLASAEGYANGHDSGRAPGKIDILLTPEASISGIVIDAKTDAPVPGAAVTIVNHSGRDAADLTDEDGRFHVTRLEPGRYDVAAATPTGYGRSVGSIGVGLAQHAGPVTVKLYPAVRVAGVITLPDAKKTPCKQGGLQLTSSDQLRNYAATRDPDGTLHADGVLPGTYHVFVACQGYHARSKYPPVIVADKDVVGLEWPVDAGAVIRGHVTTKSGAPVERARVVARSTGGGARDSSDWASDQSTRDGSYQLEGLQPGSFKLDVYSEHGVAPKDGWKVTVPATSSVVDQALVLEDGGSIHGTVVDADGKPLGGISVMAQAISSGPGWGGPSVRSNDDGTFALDELRPGDYRVIASRGEWWASGSNLKKPGATDDAKHGEKATVQAAQVTTVRIVVEATSGVIRGKVEDADGKPVTDAFVSASRESDAAGAQGSNVDSARWSADNQPVLTGTDGTFTITKLPPGNYTLFAQRKGGGEASAEHVPVGATTRLQIKPTGSIEGTVHRQVVRRTTW